MNYRHRLNGYSDDETVALVFAIVAIVIGITLYIMFLASFEVATFQVSQRSWWTESELYHTETSMDCDPVTTTDPNTGISTTTIECEPESYDVVDERYTFSGTNDDPITYYSFLNHRWDQKTRYAFHADVKLIVNEQKTITYKPNQRTYESLASGMYCVGEVGWFNHVRNLNCSGR